MNEGSSAARAEAGRAAVTVCVLGASDGAPLPDLEVALVERKARLAARTDAAGEARFELDGSLWSLGDLVLLEVAHSREVEFFQASRDERVLFRGRVELAERVVLRVEDCVELVGTVVDALGIPLRMLDVSAWEPAAGARYTSVFLARDAELGADGVFALRVCGRRALPEVELQLLYDGGGLRRLVPWSELVSSEGAVLALDLVEYLVEVRDERGRPLAGATVRARPSRGAAAFPAELASDTAGQARFRFPAGEVYVSAGLAGHAPAALWCFRPPGGASYLAPLTLRTLSASEEVRGLVRLAAGTPVADALVSAVPEVALPDADLGGAALVQVRSGADGRFRLPWAADEAVELVAHARGRGLSHKVLAGPSERDVELVIEEQGGLELHLAPVQLAREYTNGRIEYVLRARATGAADADHAFDLPLRLDELALGDYDVWVLHHGWGAWAEGFARVEGGAEARVTLEARALRKARGRLLRPDGTPAAGVRLRPLVPGWPELLADVWTATVAPDGSFELVLGAAQAARALPREGERLYEPLAIAAGDGQELVLREN